MCYIHKSSSENTQIWFVVYANTFEKCNRIAMYQVEILSPVILIIFPYGHASKNDWGLYEIIGLTHSIWSDSPFILNAANLTT